MRLAWLLAVALGCTPAAPSEPAGPRNVATTPRLALPSVLDPGAPDAAYRVAVAAQFQPRWAQFLDDCRLRLPATDPLNLMTLAATVDLAVDASGKVVDILLLDNGSGNADFDRAIRQVIADAAPLPRPPADLWSDDDRVHLRWLFARDRRQAGPVTTAVLRLVMPLHAVTERLIMVGHLARAAHRIKREPAGTERDEAITKLMTAGLREALASTDTGVRRAAIEAIDAAGLGLSDDLLEIYRSANDADVLVAVIETLTGMGDHRLVKPLVERLPKDLRDSPRLAVVEAQALVAFEEVDAVLGAVTSELAATPNPVALQILGLLELKALDDPKNQLRVMFAKWQRSTEARVRAALCTAHTRASIRPATEALALGLKDRDAKVRAACLDTIAARMAFANEQKLATYIGAKNLTRIAALVRDRDVLVRAAAIHALGAVHPDVSTFPDLVTDASAEVRTAYLRAIAQVSQLRPMDGGRERVRRLFDDLDAGVRAAAWGAFVVLLRRPIDKTSADPPPADFDKLLANAIKDPAPEVRRAVIDAIKDEAVLIRLAGDDDAEVRTRALVRFALRSGYAASADVLLGRFASASPASAERVRVALAWHLAY